MTTPDTAAVRSWAREQGLVVADRGRLPAEVLDAYTAAHAEGSRSAAAARKPTARKPGTTASRRPTASRSTGTRGAGKRSAERAATGTADRTTTADRPITPSPVAEQPVSAQEPVEVAVVPAPAAVEDDRRLADLVQQVAALSQRVAALETAAAARPARNRFRFGR